LRINTNPDQKLLPYWGGFTMAAPKVRLYRP